MVVSFIFPETSFDSKASTSILDPAAACLLLLFLLVLSVILVGAREDLTVGLKFFSQRIDISEDLFLCLLTICNLLWRNLYS